uniref:BAH domain-containing protein n=1 Tax=Elaeophora elaphi TaxID=1147741 RepID=A0A0R3RI12_9BILA
MITTATTPTSTMPAAVDVAPNLVITDQRGSTMERNQPEQRNQQFLFVDNDKDELQLNNEPTVPDWTEVVQISNKTVIDTNGYNKLDDQNSKKSVKMTATSEAPAFDFTKIETLFSNSTTTSSANKRECEEADGKDDGADEAKVESEEVTTKHYLCIEISVLKSLKIEDLVFENIVTTEVNSKGSNNNKGSLQHRNNSLNDSVCAKKSLPSYDEEPTKCLNRNTGKEKKLKTKEKDILLREPSASPPFKRSLTPSLDPKLLRQFEEEDRPKRVLRSSTVAASTPKITLTNSNGTVISDNSAKVINHGFAVKMAATKSATRKSVVKKSKQKKPKKLQANFTADNTFSVRNVFHPAQLNEKMKRKRSQSKNGNKEIGLHSKRLKAEINGLLNNELVVALEGLRNNSVRPRHWSGASSSRASTSSGSNGFTVITKTGKRRGSSRIQRNIFNSHWKLIGPPFESPVYVDYFFHEKLYGTKICYSQAVHSKTGDLLRPRDSVLVNSADGEPNFACICRLFSDPETGLPLASVLWYYTPIQVKTETVLAPPVFERELLASKHMDIIPLDTVDEIIWVLTYNEYGRFMAETRNDTYPLAQRVREEDLLWKKGEDDYPRRVFLPRDDTPLELVYFCRRIYDCKLQKVDTKNVTERSNQIKRSRRHPWRQRAKKHR